MANLMPLVVALLAIAASADAAFTKKPKKPGPHPGSFPGRLGVGRTAVAYFDMNGVNGTVQLYQEHRDAPVYFHINLQGLDQYPTERFPWHVHMYPVDFSLLQDFPCSLSAIGDHYDPFGVAAGLTTEEYDANCQANISLCEIGDFSRKLGRLTSEPWQSFTDPNLSLFGPLTPIGRSLLIHRENGERWICSNFELHGVKILSLKYNFVSGPFEGDVVIRRMEGRDESKILVDIHKTTQEIDEPLASENHMWGLRKFEEGFSAVGENCTGVGKIYGEHALNLAYQDFTRCGFLPPQHQRECFIGDLSSKCGPLNFDNTGRARVCCLDSQLGTHPLTSIEPLILTIKGEDNSEDIIACATSKPANPLCARAKFRTNLHFIQLYFVQLDPHDRTFVHAYVIGLNGQGGYFEIHDNPVPEGSSQHEICSDFSDSGLGGVFDKPGGRLFSDGVSSGGTGRVGGNTIPIGVLDQKLSDFRGQASYTTTDFSHFLPLFGPFSIIGKSLVLFDADGNPIACGNIELNKLPASTIDSILGYGH